MRIGIELCQIIEQQSGGIVQYLAHLLKQLFSQYPEVDFVLYHTSQSYRIAPPLPANVQQVQLDEADFWLELDLKLAEAGVEVLFRTFPCEERLAFPGSRQIGLIPDLQHEYMAEFFSPTVLESRHKAFSQLLNNSGAIVVLSEYSRSSLLQYYPQTEAKTVVVSPALTLEDSDLHQLTPEETALLPQTPFFFYPANLWPHKNHRRLFMALELFLSQRWEVESVGLVLTGDPTGWSELAAEYPHLDVRHLGYVSPALLKALYPKALALTNFSLYEGFGLPLLEAFEAGTAVLCSDSTSLVEVGGEAVLNCDPTDIEAMAGLMRQLLEKPSMRTKLIERGKAQLGRYSWQASAQQFMETCQSLAARPIEQVEVLQALYPLLSRLQASQQSNREKEQAIQKLLATAQERLELINELKQEADMLRAAAQERLELIKQLDTQLKLIL